jgi:hypothetical protein
LLREEEKEEEKEKERWATAPYKEAVDPAKTTLFQQAALPPSILIPTLASAFRFPHFFLPHSQPSRQSP